MPSGRSVSDRSNSLTRKYETESDCINEEPLGRREAAGATAAPGHRAKLRIKGTERTSRTEGTKKVALAGVFPGLAIKSKQHARQRLNQFNQPDRCYLGVFRGHSPGPGPKKQIKKPGREPGLFYLIWRRPTLAEAIQPLPSARGRLTAVFGMGTGRTTPLGSPKVLAHGHSGFAAMRAQILKNIPEANGSEFSENYI